MNPGGEAVLEARLYEQPVLTFSTAGGELAPPEEIHAAPDAWRLTGAWTPGIDIDGKAVERWLRGLRPQNGARSAQRLRARERIERLKIQRTALGEGDIVWATPGMEYPGAVQFRSMLGGDEDLSEGKISHEALRHEDLEGLLEQVITEMRLGAIDPRRVGYQPVTPSGSLAKFAVHRAPNDGQWYLPDRNRLSTHIVKHEDRAEMPAEAAIESICQRSLRRLGIRAAPTRAAMIGHRQVIVSERSDREVNAATGAVHAIHQEEWACACGRDPDELIQRAGTNGGWADLYRFLTERNTEPEREQRHFWKVLAAIALLGHRDMHRRNVGVRYARANAPANAELAPLYDVASMDGQKAKHWRSLGLPIGGEEEIEQVGEHAWTRMAEMCRTDPGEVLEIVAETARMLPDAITDAVTEARNEDEWRDREEAETRMETLRRGTTNRAGKTLRARALRTAHFAQAAFTEALESPDLIPAGSAAAPKHGEEREADRRCSPNNRTSQTRSATTRDGKAEEPKP